MTVGTHTSPVEEMSLDALLHARHAPRGDALGTAPSVTHAAPTRPDAPDEPPLRRASAPSLGHAEAPDEAQARGLLLQRLRTLPPQQSKGEVLLTYTDRLPTSTLVAVAVEELDRFLRPEQQPSGRATLQRTGSAVLQQLRSLKSKQVAGLLTAVEKLSEMTDDPETRAVAAEQRSRHAQRVHLLEEEIEQTRASFRAEGSFRQEGDD